MAEENAEGVGWLIEGNPQLCTKYYTQHRPNVSETIFLGLDAKHISQSFQSPDFHFVLSLCMTMTRIHSITLKIIPSGNAPGKGLDMAVITESRVN